MGKKRNKRDYSKQLFLDGHQYKTISEFCTEFNLKYSTVRMYLGQGLNAVQILESTMELPITENDNEGKPEKPITVDGITYKSMTDACTALGISPHMVRALQTNKLFRADSAIKAAVKMKQEHDYPGDDSRPRPEDTVIAQKVDRRHTSPTSAGIPCIVAGQRFHNYKEACDAYQVPYPTVMARMQRNNSLTIEEAILSGDIRRRYIKPILGNSWEPVNYHNCDETANSDMSAICQVARNNSIKVNLVGCYETDTEEKWFAELIVPWSVSPRGLVVRVYHSDDTPAFISKYEFIAHLELHDSMPTNGAVNYFNYKYAGVTLYFENKLLYARGIFTGTVTGKNGRQFMYTFNRFVGNVEAIASELHLED